MNLFRWIFSGWGSMSDNNGIQMSLPSTHPISNARNTTPDGAIQISTVYACVDLLSRTIASLPIDVYKVNTDGSKEKDTQCTLAYILGKSPNYSMTPFEFWQTMTMHWALRGNAYALIKRRSDGQVQSLIPLSPDQMKVTLEKGKVHYYYLKADRPEYEIKNEDILHWKCMGNGYIGLSKLEYMRASIDEGYYCQENALDLFAKKGKLSGILSADNNITATQKKEIAEAFARSREGGIPVIPTSMHFQALSLSPADTQLLETRRFSVEEICRWFGVASALINSSGGASGGTIEQVTANFYKSTILPMCRSAEQAILKRVASIDERHDHEIRFRLSDLYKANDKDRFSIYAQAVQNGLMTRNEVRTLEGLPPCEGGDELTVQTNLSPVDQLANIDPSQEPQTPLTTEAIRQ